MDENFRDAAYHLRWAARHTVAGCKATIDPGIERLRRRLQTAEDVDEPAASTEGVRDRIADHLSGAHRRVRHSAIR